MEIQEARDALSKYKGNELYGKAINLYQAETDARIRLRSPDEPHSRAVIDSVVNEMRPWMQAVGNGLSWDDDKYLDQLIELETGNTWVRYRMLDPRIEEYREAVRLERLKGTRLPLFEALTRERLNAVGSMMLAQIQQEAREYLADKEIKQEP